MAAGGGRPGSAAPGAGAWRSGSAQPCCGSPGGRTRHFCRPFSLSRALSYEFISIIFLSNCICSRNTFALRCFSRVSATKSAVSEGYRRAHATPMAPAGRAARNAAAPAGRAEAPRGAPPPSASSARRAWSPPALRLPNGPSSPSPTAALQPAPSSSVRQRKDLQAKNASPRYSVPQPNRYCTEVGQKW